MYHRDYRLHPPVSSNLYTCISYKFWMQGSQ